MGQKSLSDLPLLGGAFANLEQKPDPGGQP